MLLVHCGGKQVTYDELQNIPLPQKTNTYMPVPYNDLVDIIKNAARAVFMDSKLDKAQYAVSKDGNRLFGVLRYISDEEPDLTSDNIGVAIGFRSSYDKSIANQICVGGQVFVCDNLVFTGKIMSMRKHTKLVFDDLLDQAYNMLTQYRQSFYEIEETRAKMKRQEIAQDDGYRKLGLLRGHNVLSPTQLTNAIDHWDNPGDGPFVERNKWSLYNACTEALKSTNQRKIMEKHIALHREMNTSYQGLVTI
jgi:hypothetical protein